MLTIPGELKTFKTTVSSGIGTMNSTLSTISSKLNEIITACSTASSSFSSNYNSKNKDAVISSVSSLGTTANEINSSVNGELKPVLSKAQELIDKVTRMEELEKEVASAEETRSIEMAKDPKDRDLIAISNANSVISKDTIEFNKLLSEATAMLNELKSFDASLDIGESQAAGGSTIIGEVSAQLQGLKEGTYNKVVYTGKNGKKVTTYIYLPKGASTTTGLSTTLYFPGAGQEAVYNGGLSAGLGANIRSGKQYDGIIVVCEAVDDKSYSNPDYLDTVKEIADNIVTTYKADSKKISCSGFSYGGSAVQHMVERNPEYFSGAVIVAQGFGAVGKESGGNREAGWEKLRKTKFLLLCGNKDDIFGEMNTTYDKLNDGGDVTKIWVDGVDHNFAGLIPITINGVKYDSYVDYIFTLTRS